MTKGIRVKVEGGNIGEAIKEALARQHEIEPGGVEVTILSPEIEQEVSSDDNQR